jgi:ubiquinone/menaquinone biosynthesis C-methylase UbiE
MLDLTKREKCESEMFDRETLTELGVERLDELEDEKLRLSDDRISMHLNFPINPPRPYRSALFQLQNLTGKKILDFCSGSGETSVIIAKKGAALVESFDISQTAVNIAKRRIKINKVGHIVNARKMSAYSLNYPDAYFDIVYGNAVLHHLDLESALREICRVLKDGGESIFCEPFSGSRALRNIRNMIPLRRNLSQHERQLTPDDVNLLNEYFSWSQFHYFGLFSRFDFIFNKEPAIDALWNLDRLLLNSWPFLERYSRAFVMKALK